MKNIYLVLVCYILTNCNSSHYIKEDTNTYNNAISSCVDYIIENDLLKGESDTMYVHKYSRIDTNSILTYGVLNSEFYYSYIDTTYGFKKEMTAERYRYYKNIQELRSYKAIHNFNNTSFSIPVEAITFKEALEKNVRRYHVNIFSPLINSRENVYQIWISKYLEPWNDNYGLMFYLVKKGNDFEVKSHRQYWDGDADGKLIFDSVEPDYIKNLQREY